MPRTILALFAAAALFTPAWAQPATPKKPIVDEYHGTKVTDDYRWLEDWNDPAVKKWSDDQNTHARSVLDKLPSVDAIRKRVTELRGAPQPEYGGLAFKAGLIFAIKLQPPKLQTMLVTLTSPDDLASEKVVVDPNQIDPKGLTSIDFYVPSLNAKLVAVSLSEGGSESGTVYVFDTANGKKLGDVVPRANGGTAGGSLAWNADGSGFYYTRYPRGAERPAEDMDFYQQVYFHRLGTPTESDTYEIGKDFPRIAEVALDSGENGKYITAAVANGDGGDFEHYVRAPDGQWVRFAPYSAHVVRTRFGGHDLLYMISLADAPRGKLVQVSLYDPVNTAEWVLPQSPAQTPVVMQDVLWSGEHLFLQELAGGPSQLRLVDLRGAEEGFVPILPTSTVDQIVRIGGADVLYRNESLLAPPAWYRVNGTNVSPVKTAMAKKAVADYSGCEVVRDTATSKDGTKIPITILRKKGIKLDGTNPTLLWGYGGYSVSEQPTYSDGRAVWIEQGGVYAIANIRGGGEFGEEWHRAGNLTRKQNVFDDFYAAMERLKELGYCTTDKLAIYGGSNGGLLMGAMIAQHPDACRAVVSAVGIYDMLRVELSSNGAFNVTEFGTVKDKPQFEALYAYSPYHHVKDGTKYPSILMLTGANNPRVDPMQSRKMVARLQAANPPSGGHPILLRTSATSGHGIGSNLNERIEQDVDRYAFLFHELGVEYKPVK